MTDKNGGDQTNDIFGNKILNSVIILTAALLFAILGSSILNSPREIVITTCSNTIECPDYKNTVVEAQIVGLGTRIDDLLNYVEYSNAYLGMIAAFFGGLITVVVIFFAIRTKNEALATVEREVEKRLEVTKIQAIKEIKKEGENILIKLYEESVRELQIKMKNEIEQVITKHPITSTDKSSTHKENDQTPPLEIDIKIPNEVKENAKKVLELDKNSRSITDWLDLGRYLLAKKEYIKASEAFDEVSQKEDDIKIKSQSDFYRGYCLYQMQKYEEAIHLFMSLMNYYNETDDTEALTTSAGILFLSSYALFSQEINDDLANDAFHNLINNINPNKSEHLDTVLHLAHLTLMMLKQRSESTATE